MKRFLTMALVAGLGLGLASVPAQSTWAQEDEDEQGFGATAADSEGSEPAESDSLLGSIRSAVGAETAPADGEEGDGRRTFAELWGYGGWIMYVLLVLSAVVLTLVLERLVALRTNAVMPRKFMRQLMEPWRKGDLSQVTKLCAASQVSIARVLRAGLLHYDEGLARVEDAVDAAGNHEATILRRNLGLISSLGNISTMIGLLGTVLGMIQAFDVIAKTGTGDARIVAGGIFQALITTAAGLMVGITAVGAHSFLRRRVEVLEINLEETSFRLIEELNRPAMETPSEKRSARDTGSLAPAGA